MKETVSKCSNLPYYLLQASPLLSFLQERGENPDRQWCYFSGCAPACLRGDFGRNTFWWTKSFYNLVSAVPRVGKYFWYESSPCLPGTGCSCQIHGCSGQHWEQFWFRSGVKIRCNKTETCQTNRFRNQPWYQV